MSVDRHERQTILADESSEVTHGASVKSSTADEAAQGVVTPCGSVSGGLLVEASSCATSCEWKKVEGNE